MYDWTSAVYISYQSLPFFNSWLLLVLMSLLVTNPFYVMTDVIEFLRFNKVKICIHFVVILERKKCKFKLDLR